MPWPAPSRRGAGRGIRRLRHPVLSVSSRGLSRRAHPFRHNADQGGHRGRFGNDAGEVLARLVWVVIGVLMIGLGSGLLKAINVGVDPYTAANIGISNLIGWDLGSYQLLSNLVLAR